MVLKFIRDHAWKFPSRPPLISVRGTKGTLEGTLEDIPENIQGSAGNQGPYTQTLVTF
ncbi:MAG: hypothetical protein OSB07_05440 [Dehalococcoidia bacterium]|nr:hypothetical protein [Dehalococcoidia bacterium]